MVTPQGCADYQKWCYLNDATLYMDNEPLFNDQEKLLQLSKSIFEDYANKYKIDNLLIFDNRHEYTISRSAITKTDYIIDTIPGKKFKR